MTKCSDDSSLFHACLRRQIDLAAKEACWFPTVPFVRSENEPCRNGSEVARSRGRLRQAVEDMPSKCDVLCRDIRVKVCLAHSMCRVNVGTPESFLCRISTFSTSVS